MARTLPVAVAVFAAALTAAPPPAPHDPVDACYTKADTWQETYRRSMEKVDALLATWAARGPKGYASPERSSPKQQLSAEPLAVDVDVTGWDALYLTAAVTKGTTEAQAVLGDPVLVDTAGKETRLTDLPLRPDTDWMHAVHVAAPQKGQPGAWAGKDGRWPFRLGNTGYAHGLLLWQGVVLRVDLGQKFRSLRLAFGPTPSLVGNQAAHAAEVSMVLRASPRPDRRALHRGVWDRLRYDFPRPEHEWERAFEGEGKATNPDDGHLDPVAGDGIWAEPWAPGDLQALAARYVARTLLDDLKKAAAAKAALVATPADLAAVRAFYLAARRWEAAPKFFPAVHRGVVREMSKRYGQAFPDAKGRLAQLDAIEKGIAAGRDLMRTDPTAGTAAVDRALEEARRFAGANPVWVHGEFPLKADREVRVSTAAELTAAFARAAPGDHIVVADGWYHGADLVAVRRAYPAANPVVVRAATPGRAHLVNTSVGAVGGGGLLFSGLVLHGGRFAATRGAENVRFTQGALLGGGFACEGRNNRIDHTFVGGVLGAGPTATAGTDPVAPSHLDHLYLGFRNAGDSNETVRCFGWGPVVADSLFEDCCGEGEVLSLKCRRTEVLRNTVRATLGTFPGRSGRDVVLDGNYLFKTAVRLEAYPGKVLRNNYLDGTTASFAAGSPNPVFGTAAWEHNTLVDSDLWLALENGRGGRTHTYEVACRDNLAASAAGHPAVRFQGYTPTTYASAGNEASLGGGKVVAGRPAVDLAAGWAAADRPGARDAFGVWRPTTPTTAGFQRTDPPFTRYDPRVGPGYLPASVRTNRRLLAEYTFDAPLVAGAADSGFGLRDAPLALATEARGAEKRLTKPGQGVSGRGIDRALNPAAVDAGPARTGPLLAKGQTGFRTFTVQGWLRTHEVPDAERVLLSGLDEATRTGVEVAYGPGAALTVRLGDGTKVKELVADGVGRKCTWTFFAVTYRVGAPDARGRPTGGEVRVYAGGAGPVAEVVRHAVPAAGVVALPAAGRFTVGSAADGKRPFPGHLDNLRVFAACDGGPDHRGVEGVVDRADLEALRRSDLGERLDPLWAPPGG